LKEKWVLLVPPQQQHDPAPPADAADPDDLPREIAVPEPLEQDAPVRRKRAQVALERFA